MDHHDYLLKVNDEIDVFIEEYKECKVTYLYDEFQINDGAKNRLSALVKKMLLYSKTNLESKVGDGSNLFIKTIKLVYFLHFIHLLRYFIKWQKFLLSH